MAELTVPLISTNVAGVSDYDESNVEFTVFFVNGGEYLISGAPRSVYDGLIAAPSPGRYYNQSIRDAYSIERIS